MSTSRAFSLIERWTSQPPAKLGGQTVWDAGDTSPPTSISSWDGNVDDRTIVAGGAAILVLEFDEDAAGSGYDVDIDFVGGESISISF